MKYEHIESMFNFYDEIIEIWVCLESDLNIGLCAAYAVNERYQVIKKGTFDTVSNYFYRRGYIY